MEPIQEAIRHLSRFGHAAKERALPVWKSARLQIEPALQWLRARPRVVFWAGGIGIAFAFLVFSGATAAGAALLGWAALRQAATASERHQEQTNADRQRRITESFSKAVEQLASDKMQMRVGGIYTLERISCESSDDYWTYWTVMETLSAFVREQVRWKSDTGTSTKDEPLPELPTDIAAILAVIIRRSESGRNRERGEGWRFDLRRTDLRAADFDRAHLECADFRGAHLEGASLMKAHFEGADFGGAHLVDDVSFAEAHFEGASFLMAHLEDANLELVHFENAWLTHAHCERAVFYETHLEGAYLAGTHLEGADLRMANLKGADLTLAIGDAKTQLPAGFARPDHWPTTES
jgi:uncharacterized protein YjbI with pentapeptide repeats